MCNHSRLNEAKVVRRGSYRLKSPNQASYLQSAPSLLVGLNPAWSRDRFTEQPVQFSLGFVSVLEGVNGQSIRQRVFLCIYVGNFPCRPLVGTQCDLRPAIRTGSGSR